MTTGMLLRQMSRIRFWMMFPVSFWMSSTNEAWKSIWHWDASTHPNFTETRSAIAGHVSNFVACTDRKFLGDAVAIVSQGLPVEIHRQANLRERIEHQIVHALPEVLARTSGNILVFCQAWGNQPFPSNHQFLSVGRRHPLHHLYGDLPPKDRDAVLQPSQQRRVIHQRTLLRLR